MRALIAIGFGAALFGCSSNKPAEAPAQYAANEPTTSAVVAQPEYPATPPQTVEPPVPEPTRADAAIPESGTHGAGNTGTSADSRLGAVRDPAPASPSTATPGASRPDADNTRVNKRDQHSTALTPMDQGNGETDLRITKEIRQAVVGNGSLSFTAKNVKIITQNGKVTLRGPVKTDAERQSIEASALSVAGAGNVDNQLEVKK